LPPVGGDTTFDDGGTELKVGGAAYTGGAELGLGGGGILYCGGVAYGGNLGGETGPFNGVGGETW
jgi:hypothetical protein